MWVLLPSIMSTIHEAIVVGANNIQAETGEKSIPSSKYSTERLVYDYEPTLNHPSAFFSPEFFHSLQQPLSSLLFDIFDVTNTSRFNAPSFVGELPQALVLTTEAALQVRTTFLSIDVTVW